jgi:hypothetical protein
VDRPPPASFRQRASYAQLLWAMPEWLVVSLITEHLSVVRPRREHLNAAKIEVAAWLRPSLQHQYPRPAQYADRRVGVLGRVRAATGTVN